MKLTNQNNALSNILEPNKKTTPIIKNCSICGEARNNNFTIYKIAGKETSGYCPECKEKKKCDICQKWVDSIGYFTIKGQGVYQFLNFCGPECKKQARKQAQELAKSSETPKTVKETREVYPVKDYLLKHSKFEKLNSKQESEKGLTEKETNQLNRLFEYRDHTHYRIKTEIAKYFDRVTNCDYRFAGMPETPIRNWIEEKIWKLLISIGEPNHIRYNGEEEENFWAEK